MAQRLCDVVIDEHGRLFNCWEDVDTPEYSFGTLDKWDPADPVETADRMDMLTRYLNTACPIADDECNECIWLPLLLRFLPSQHTDKADPSVLPGHIDGSFVYFYYALGN